MFLFCVSHVIPPPGNPGHPEFCVDWPGQPHRQHTLELPPQQLQHCQPRCSSSATAQQSVFPTSLGCPAACPAAVTATSAICSSERPLLLRPHLKYLQFFQFESSVLSCCTKPTANESWVGATHTCHGLKSSQQTERHSLQLRPPTGLMYVPSRKVKICIDLCNFQLQSSSATPISHFVACSGSSPATAAFCPMTRPAIEAAALPASQKQKISRWWAWRFPQKSWRVWVVKIGWSSWFEFRSLSCRQAHVQSVLRILIRKNRYPRYLQTWHPNCLKTAPNWPQQSTFLWTQTSMKMPWDFSTALAAEVPRLGSQGGIGWLVVNVEYGWISLKAPFWVPLVIKCLW